MTSCAVSMSLYVHQFSSVQSLSNVRLFATPWTAAHLASLSVTNSQSFLKLMSIESCIHRAMRLTLRPEYIMRLRLSHLILSENSEMLCFTKRKDQVCNTWIPRTLNVSTLESLQIC